MKNIKNLTRTKNIIVALVVMAALIVTSINVVPSKAESTFTVVTSPCTVQLNSTSFAKDYITVKDGDKVLTENVDYIYDTDPLKASTTMVTTSAGMWVWSGTIYGMGDYSEVTKSVSLSFTVTVTAPTVTPIPSTPTVPSNPTVTTPVTSEEQGTNNTTATTNNNTITTTTNTTETTATTKPIEGTVTFKKFMEKYCNYGVYTTKDGKYASYTIGKTSNSKSHDVAYPCSPQYRFVHKGVDDLTGKQFTSKVGYWDDWDKNYKDMANMALPARLWKKYTAEGNTADINCMLDDFEKLPELEKQLHISNYTYGQILKAAEKVGRTVDVAVLPLVKSGKKPSYCYNVSVEDGGVQVYYCRQIMPSYYYWSNIASSFKSINKVEVQWKRKGDTSWRTGSRDPYHLDVQYSIAYPMGKGDIYRWGRKQTYYWTNVTIIKIRQYRTINGKNYYTDWKTVYQSDDGKVKTDKKSDKTSSTKANTNTKTKTIAKGKKAKVKVAYTNKKKIQWKSANSKVVKVVKKSGKGYNTITLKGVKAGKTTITGKGKGKTFKIKVTVKKK